MPVRYASSGAPLERLFKTCLGIICEKNGVGEDFDGKTVDADRSHFRYTAIGQSKMSMAEFVGKVTDSSRNTEYAQQARQLDTDAIEIWNDEGERMVVIRVCGGTRTTYMVYTTSNDYAVYLTMRIAS